MSNASSVPPWSTESYWKGRFGKCDTPWELGAPSKVLMEACGELSALGVPVSGKRVLSAGCGRGADAIEFALRGAHVLAVDWSAIALNDLQERFESQRGTSSGSVEIRHGDFFTVSPEPLDMVIEHTFFCAIDPSKRSLYAEKMAAWLRPGGFLIGNFFIVSDAEAASLRGLSLTREGAGPPFAATVAEVESLFSPWFARRVFRQGSLSEESRRPGLEWVAVFERR